MMLDTTQSRAGMGPMRSGMLAWGLLLPAGCSAPPAAPPAPTALASPAAALPPLPQGTARTGRYRPPLPDRKLPIDPETPLTPVDRSGLHRAEIVGLGHYGRHDFAAGTNWYRVETPVGGVLQATVYESGSVLLVALRDGEEAMRALVRRTSDRQYAESLWLESAGPTTWSIGVDVPAADTGILFANFDADPPVLRSVEPAVATVGELVVLRGSGLGIDPAQTMVTIDAVRQEIVEQRPSRIVLRLVPATRSGDLMVMLAGARSAPIEITVRDPVELNLRPCPATDRREDDQGELYQPEELSIYVDAHARPADVAAAVARRGLRLCHWYRFSNGFSVAAEGHEDAADLTALAEDLANDPIIEHAHLVRFGTEF